MENKIISIVSGGFDPVHPGHIMMMNDCLGFSDYLIVGVNSNQWLINKKGNFFMDIKHRLYVVNSLAAVNEAIEFEDDSKGSASNLLIAVRKKFPSNKIIFANGGDRKPGYVPEYQICEELGIEMRETRITRDEVYLADEAFFTGTAAEVTPICNLDERDIGAGNRGPITEKLQSMYFDQVAGKRSEHPEWHTLVS